ncbi:MAG: iron-containing alcohol dehydrogenase [Spirochaetales bacterium]|nr:iron-containing alcohol dehydrogenase [Spirochaetales bacterium]
MMKKPFEFIFNPHVIFGCGSIQKLPSLIKSRSQNVLLVLGGRSFGESSVCEKLQTSLKNEGIEHSVYNVPAEPSPGTINKAVDDYRERGYDLVAAIGGGSALDAGKAISAMLCEDGPVEDYLEGSDRKILSGRKKPFIAVPTTSGTGSEATKNAVISQVGKNGFKLSLRHDNYVPDLALIDPELTLSCPEHITVYCGLDALSQLVESYISTKSNSLSDTLAENGLQVFGRSFTSLVSGNLQDIEARTGMAYAAFLSGLTLANAGLGAVHGVAGPMGGMFPIPHGAGCALLLKGIMAETEKYLLDRDKDNPALKKMKKIAFLLSGREGLNLSEALADLYMSLKLPGLDVFGIRREDLPDIAARANNKNHPVQLSGEDFVNVLRNAG